MYQLRLENFTTLVPTAAVFNFFLSTETNKKLAKTFLIKNE